MDAILERLVRQRAGGRCEYCRLPEAGTGVPFEIDHVIARKHRGRTVAGNLAMSLHLLQRIQGGRTSPASTRPRGKLVGLFHPRRHGWTYHFLYQGGLC